MTVEAALRVQYNTGANFLNLPRPLVRFMCTARSVGDASVGFIRHNWNFNPDARPEMQYIAVTEISVSVHDTGGADQQVFAYINNSAWPDYAQVNVAATQYTVLAELVAPYSSVLTQCHARLLDPSKPAYLGRTNGSANSILYVGAETNPTAAGYLYSTVCGYASPKPFVLPGSMAY